MSTFGALGSYSPMVCVFCCCLPRVTWREPKIPGTAKEDKKKQGTPKINSNDRKSPHLTDQAQCTTERTSQESSHTKPTSIATLHATNTATPSHRHICIDPPSRVIAKVLSANATLCNTLLRVTHTERDEMNTCPARAVPADHGRKMALLRTVGDVFSLESMHAYLHRRLQRRPNVRISDVTSPLANRGWRFDLSPHCCTSGCFVWTV